ncbi:MAG: RluA family pseudouridine synthase [Bacteroidota bacterium]
MGIFRQAVTKSAWKRALKKQYVRVNGATASSATFIRGGETISLSIPEEDRSKKKLILPLTVLWEDEYLAVIHKLAGILVSGNRFKTIANALPQNIKPSPLADATTPQPVHRLDYATTGVVLVGKTSSSIRALNKMFEAKQIKKTYYAAAIGEMNDSGVITADIDGKKAHSEYTIEESVRSERFGKLNLVQLIPQTGRRHQLRKHLSAIGNPILGDKDYGTEGLILNGKGLYLHAYSLRFTHPCTGKNIYVKCEVPQKFKKIFSHLA